MVTITHALAAANMIGPPCDLAYRPHTATVHLAFRRRPVCGSRMRRPRITDSPLDRALTSHGRRRLCRRCEHHAARALHAWAERNERPRLPRRLTVTDLAVSALMAVTVDELAAVQTAAMRAVKPVEQPMRPVYGLDRFGRTHDRDSDPGGVSPSLLNPGDGVIRRLNIGQIINRATYLVDETVSARHRRRIELAQPRFLNLRSR